MAKRVRMERRIDIADSKYFRGERMTCEICGTQEQSDPKVSSQWTVFEVDGQPHYVCTAHFPPPNAGANAFKVAYLRIFEKLFGTEKK